MRVLPAGGGAVTGYTDEHAAAGVTADLPGIDTWANQYKGRGYTVEIECPEFTAICPKTGLPDFATLLLTYEPRDLCLELKSFKLYLLAYRGIGIFQENAVNRVLDDVVAACSPAAATVAGCFNPRGGLTTTITARYSD